MKNNQSTALIASAITTAVLALSATAVFADSAKVFFAANSHYYQRFDSPGINWNVAKLNCETLKGHLATFPGDNTENETPETTFVYANLVDKSIVGTNQYYYIGAQYTPSTQTWAWITNEAWGWLHYKPNTTGWNYFAVRSDDGFWYFKPVQPLSLTGSSHVEGYVCEWDGNHFVGSATVPDLNANGVDEIASLYLDYKNNKHTVKIRDPQTHAIISTLTFATSTTPPIGLAVVADMNINGIPEIAVLSRLNVQIKDAKNNTKVLSSINFLNNKYQPRALSVMPDANHNGFDELTVLGVLQNGKSTSETRDTSTKAILFSDTF
ncbi:MAG: lectin-like protein [Methylovulum sp.]|uniref:lectin-like protein n=1 Tax=Methylovulum sp. TaxID=1916980 RepID=UPI00261507A4|nr:lectin-like protein [Methylovulum sp.]MDD2723721.1 lectin-like protein [Methylovulum sp.]